MTWLSRLRASLRELSEPACPTCHSIDVDAPVDGYGWVWCRCRTCGRTWELPPVGVNPQCPHGSGGPASECGLCEDTGLWPSKPAPTLAELEAMGRLKPHALARVEPTPPLPISLRRFVFLAIVLIVLGTVALSQIESCTQQGQPFDMRRPR